MSTIERGYHPLTDLEAYEVPKIDFNIGLPDYVKTEEIGINVRAIHRMMRLGALSNLLSGVYQVIHQMLLL